MSLTRTIKEKALDLGVVGVGVTTPEPFALYAEELNNRLQMYEWGKTLSQKTSVRDLDLTRFVDPARFLQGLGMKVLYGPAPARMAGARAGVTNYGKNCFAFANEAAGQSSWVVNEPYLVDRALDPDLPTLQVACPENCQQCIEACPTGALYAPLKMDPRKFIAFHSYFNDGESPRDLRAKMGTWVYGCDLCQEVCPRNKKWLGKAKTMNQALVERAEHLQITTLLTMSQEHYERNVWPLLYYIRKENRRLWQRNA